MCFSAGASFGAGAVLALIGAASITKAKSRSGVFFAAIPLIFSVQQITEGILWLSIADTGNEVIKNIITWIFLFFAQIVWPAWVPYSILKFEDNKGRKGVLTFFLIIGSVVSLYLGWCLLSFHVQAEIAGKHISYEQDYPTALSRYGGFLYVLATIVPPFISTVKYMWLVGFLILISYIITSVFYTDYIVSVWCFFASIISIMVYIVIWQATKLPAIKIGTAS
ncbi:MAG: DUF6629 family protein [Bacteroidia bacterium]